LDRYRRISCRKLRSELSDVGHLVVVAASVWVALLARGAHSRAGVAVRCQRSCSIVSADQAMSVISWWYPHQVEWRSWPGVLVLEHFGSRQFSIEPVVAVRCQRCCSEFFVEQVVMSVIAWWYPHRFGWHSLARGALLEHVGSRVFDEPVAVRLCQRFCSESFHRTVVIPLS
jgi:hypothetical protein